MNTMKTTLAAVAALGITSTAALAQNVSANNLVSVQLSNVSLLNNLARDLDVNVSQIPVTVQVPIGIAATVCNVSAAVLAQGGDAGGQCTAETTTRAFNSAVGRQLITQ